MSLSRSALFPHLVVFIICFAILAGAIILTPPSSDSSYLRLGGLTIPYVCTFRNLTGLPCPGCGLARSIVSGAHGDIVKSLHYHKLGLATLYYICLQFVFNLVILTVPKWRPRLARFGKILNKGLIVLGVLFIINWIFTLLKYFGSSPV